METSIFSSLFYKEKNDVFFFPHCLQILSVCHLVKNLTLYEVKFKKPLGNSSFLIFLYCL